MKVVIAGSRGITDPQLVEDAIALSGFHITEVVSGTARGVDRMGETWAQSRGIPVVQFPADWKGKGKMAGFFRNQTMAGYCDAAVIIWDGESRGTAHMLKITRALGKPVFVYHAKKESAT